MLLFLLCDWLQEVIVGIFVFWASCDPVSCSCCYYAGVQRVLTNERAVFRSRDLCWPMRGQYSGDQWEARGCLVSWPCVLGHQCEQQGCITHHTSHIIGNGQMSWWYFFPMPFFLSFVIILYVSWRCMQLIISASKLYRKTPLELKKLYMTPWSGQGSGARGHWTLTSHSGKSLRSDDKEGSRQSSVSVLHVLWFRHERE